MSSRPARAAAALIVSIALANGASGASGAPASAEPAEPAEPADLAAENHVRDLFHDGYGMVTVEGRHPTAPHEVHYVVRVTWSGDGHPADATTALTATVMGPAGPLPPVTLLPQDTDGRFAGRVSFPGDGLWTVRFSAPHPLTTWDTVELLPQVAPPLPFV